MCKTIRNTKMNLLNRFIRRKFKLVDPRGIEPRSEIRRTVQLTGLKFSSFSHSAYQESISAKPAQVVTPHNRVWAT